MDAIDPPGRPTLDPTALDPTAPARNTPNNRRPTLDPTALDPTALEPGALDPTALEPGALEPGALEPGALDRLFREARTAYAWKPDAVPDDTLRALHGLLKMGPTSANCSPARFVFVRSDEGKAKLKQALSPGNVEKTMSAPVIAIVAHDPKFYDELPRLFPHADARSWFAGNWSLADTTAFRNGTLQGAYLILAARALGLDCGPMSGFDNARLDELFFAGSGWKSNFLVNLGFGVWGPEYTRAPRLSFDEACRLA